MNRAARILLMVVLGLFAAWVQACRVATRAVNPDENQFVASAVMVSREGLLPYRDFPYMHLPYQTFVLAGLYWLGAEHLLLTARAMNGALGLTTIAMAAGLIVAAGRRSAASWLLGAVAGVVLLFNPLFAYTSGLSWNHDGSVFLLLASVAMLWRGLVTGKTSWIAGAGLALSLATGVRATIAPLVVPMLAAILWHVYVTRRLRPRAIVMFIVVGIAGQLPTLVLAAMAPEQFLWGNIGYAQLNTQLRTDTAFDRAMSLRGKLAYLRDVVFAWGDHRRGDLLLLGWAVVASTVVGLFVLRKRERDAAQREPDDWKPVRPPVLLLVSLVPFAMLGSLLPTPSWVQYYYILMPLMLVAAGCTVAFALSHTPTTNRRLSRAAAAVAVLSLAAVALESARKLAPEERCLRWPAVVVPLQVHDQGVRLADRARGRVWTIDPLYPLEGGCKVFAEMTPGAYAYRTGNLIEPLKRKRLHIIGSDNLIERLSAEPTPPTLLVREPRIVNGRQTHEDDEAARTYALEKAWTATPLDARYTVMQP